MNKRKILLGLMLGLICCPLFAQPEETVIPENETILNPLSMKYLHKGKLSVGNDAFLSTITTCCEVIFETDKLEDILKKYPNAVVGRGSFLFIPQEKDGELIGFKAIRIWKDKDGKGNYKYYVLKAPRSSFEMVTTEMPLHKKKPMGDSGSGDYSVLFSTSPWGAKLYELGWQIGPMGSGLYIYQHRFYLLQSPDGKWSWGGKGPTLNSSKSGMTTSFIRDIKTKVNWGTPDKSGYLSFESSYTSSETGRDFPAREMLVTYGSGIKMQFGHSWHEGVIKEGAMSWVKAKEGDTVDTIAKRVAVWRDYRPLPLSKIGKIGKRYVYGENLTPQQEKDNEAMIQGCKRIILELNPKILEKPIQIGQIVYIDRKELPIIVIESTKPDESEDK